MKKHLPRVILIAITLCAAKTHLAQRINLGTAVNFSLFTSNGAVSNTGLSQFKGHIGTNKGAVTIFQPPAIVYGNIYEANSITAQCTADLSSAYTQIHNTPATNTSHAPTFGGGETVLPGVYLVSAAGSAAGDLILDAQGRVNAIFIFKFDGALTTGAGTTIKLVNGALACNVYWQAEGSITIAGANDMQGTLIANNGAITMAAGSTLQGRMFSTAGPVTVDASSVTTPLGCSLFASLPVPLHSFTGVCNKKSVSLQWQSSNNDGPMILERSTDAVNWQTAATIATDNAVLTMKTYNYTDRYSINKVVYYRIKQAAPNAADKYSTILMVKECNNGQPPQLAVYPSPAKEQFEILYNGNKKRVTAIDIYNATGKKVYAATSFRNSIVINGYAPGIYFISIKENDTVVGTRLMVK